MSTELTPGAHAQVRFEVGESDTAIALGSGDVPVLATPRVLAVCEEATVLAIAAALEDSSSSVGTHVEIDHLAASHIGEVVTARAELVEVDGPRLIFDISMVNAGGDVVAEGRIHRAIVDRARFLER